MAGAFCSLAAVSGDGSHKVDMNGSQPSPLPLDWIGWVPRVWQALAPSGSPWLRCHLAGAHRVPLVSLNLPASLFPFLFVAAISDCPSLERVLLWSGAAGAGGGAADGGCQPGPQMAPAWVMLATSQTERRASCKFIPFFSWLWARGLFVLFASHPCVLPQPSTAGSSVSQPVHQCGSESVKSSWLSDVLPWDERKRRPLPVMCQVLSWQTDANEPGKCATPRYAPVQSWASVPSLTNTDWQNILSVLECRSRGLTTFWDGNE